MKKEDIKEFFRPTKWKILIFLLLMVSPSINFFSWDIFKDPDLITFIFVTLMIILSYIGSALVVRFYPSFKEIIAKKKDSKLDSDILSYILTRKHFLLIIISFLFIPALIYGRKYGVYLVFISPVGIAIIFFIYWVYYKNKLKNEKKKR